MCVKWLASHVSCGCVSKYIYLFSVDVKNWIHWFGVTWASAERIFCFYKDIENYLVLNRLCVNTREFKQNLQGNENTSSSWRHLPTGGRYMVSEKQVNKSFRSSILFWSWNELCGGECANPTPASQMYSQLSIVPMSSGLSCGPKNKMHEKQNSEKKTILIYFKSNFNNLY